jgi:hypothetical protein
VQNSCKIKSGSVMNFREKTSNWGESLRSGGGKKEKTNHMISSKSRTSVPPDLTAVLPESDLVRPVFVVDLKERTGFFLQNHTVRTKVDLLEIGPDISRTWVRG